MTQLAANDIEAFFHEFHGELHVAAPTKWEPEIVANRLICATRVVATITHRVGHKKLGSCWPAITASYEDILGYATERRQQVWDDWSKQKPQYSDSVISMAEEALSWPAQYLPTRRDEARALLLWAHAKSASVPVERVMKKANIPVSTARKYKTSALKFIVAGLINSGVPVKEARHF